MTRRQGRWLIIIMLVNTVLLAVGVAGPQIGPAVRKEIDGFFARRAAARAEEQKAATRARQRQQPLADQAQWLAHAFPAGAVVFEEDPALAAAYLISGKGFQAVNSQSPPSVPGRWQSPVIAPTPLAVDKLRGIAFSPDEGVLFLHERRTPAGQPNLVCVSLSASHRGVDMPMTSLDQRVVTEVTLLAQAFDPIRPNADASSLAGRACSVQRLTLLKPPELDTVIHFTGNSRPGPHEVRPGAYLRFHAGTADPKDTSHFTIPYRLGDVAGTIDGWLRDDAIELRGREGQMGPQLTWLLPAPKQ
jgi:hypothetical protein